MDKVYGRSIQITAWTQNKEGNLYIKANIKSNGLTFHRGKNYQFKIWENERLIRNNISYGAKMYKYC